MTIYIGCTYGHIFRTKRQKGHKRENFGTDLQRANQEFHKRYTGSRKDSCELLCFLIEYILKGLYSIAFNNNRQNEL